MDKQNAKKRILEYFKKNHIPYKHLNEEQKIQELSNIDTIYFSSPAPNVIHGHIETTLRFRESHVYCQSYYCQPVVEQDEEEINRACRIINYINSNLFYDSIYQSSLALNEDDGDIYNGTLIRYELLEEYFYETMSYILDLQVQKLSDICAPILGYITKEANFHLAAHVLIGNMLMEKSIPYIDD